MRTITLNIGLHIAGHVNDKFTVGRRGLLAVRTLRHAANAHVVGALVVDVSYPSPAGPVTEATLIVQIEEVPAIVLAAACFSVCDALEQDCVAVRDDTTGIGMLMGPKAAEWGDFNPDLFHSMATGLPAKVADHHSV